MLGQPQSLTNTPISNIPDNLGYNIRRAKNGYIVTINGVRNNEYVDESHVAINLAEALDIVRELETQKV